MGEKLLNGRQLCLDQAHGFIVASEYLSDINCPHIVYHLSLLALEEVSKASTTKWWHTLVVRQNIPAMN